MDGQSFLLYGRLAWRMCVFTLFWFSFSFSGTRLLLLCDWLEGFTVLFPCLSAYIALGTLGFGDHKEEAKAVLQEAKAVAAKKRWGSTRLENLGIPEEELLRQQQELFEKVRLHEVVDF